MELQACANCGHCWEGEEKDAEGERIPCPNCSSTARSFNMNINETVNTFELWEGKIKDPTLPSRQKVRVEFFDGQDWSFSMEKYVNKSVTIDKRQDLYHKKVTDPETGKIIHECREPLSEHRGHGSAKTKNKP